MFSAEKEWGDGIRGLALSAARYSLLRLEEGPPHTKNWRPQILILAKPNDELNPKYRKIFSFAAQLKAGKGFCFYKFFFFFFELIKKVTFHFFFVVGLTVCVSAIAGEYAKNASEALAAKQSLRKVMDEERVKGFADVVVAKSIPDALSHL